MFYDYYAILLLFIRVREFFLVDRVKNAFVGWRMNCRYEQCVNLLSNVKYCVLE